jgi:AraC-like DNA-binding protein
MNTLILLGAFSGIAVTVSIFLASYFLFIRTEDRVRNSLLGVLYLAVALRIGKSIFYYLMDGMDAIGVALGFLGLASIGPALLLYITNSYRENPKLNWQHALHFLIPLSGFFVIWMREETKYPLYFWTTIILAIYLIAISYKHIKSKSEFPVLAKWNNVIIISTSVIWACLMYQLVSDGIIGYAYGAAGASLIIYVQFFYVLKNPVLFPRTTVKTIPVLPKEELKLALEKEKLYTKSAITLSSFSEHLGSPSYLVSKAINQHYGKTFPELINYYRVEAVKEKLISGEDKLLKIEGLAYEVGFNTPSAFYAAFKKETSMSPKEFKKRAVAVS